MNSKLSKPPYHNAKIHFRTFKIQSAKTPCPLNLAKNSNSATNLKISLF